MPYVGVVLTRMALSSDLAGFQQKPKRRSHPLPIAYNGKQVTKRRFELDQALPKHHLSYLII